MAKRQDSGSNSSPENQRPTPPNEDTLPEFTENARGRGEDDAGDTDEFEEDDTEEEPDEEDSF